MNVISRFTLRSMKLNKIRTVMTVLGIVLSVSLITAVPMLAKSIQQFMIDDQIRQYGAWNALIYDADEQIINSLNSDKKIESTLVVGNEGFAFMESASEFQNDFNLLVLSLKDFDTDMLPDNLLVGRYPENNNELILSQDFINRSKKRYHVGDEITLDLYRQFDEKGEVYPWLSVLSIEESELSATNTYTVVGIYGQNTVLPAHSGLTLAEGNEKVMAFVKLKDISDTVSYFDDSRFSGYDISFNENYLAYSGANEDSIIIDLIYAIAAAVMVIVAAGSYSLIYNSFSMSITERTKQLGILSSVGATRKQIYRSVFTEVAALSAIGIPIGLAVGVALISVAFAFVNPLLSGIIRYGFDAAVGNELELKVILSPSIFITAAIVGIVTISISAMIPAVRVMRMSVIDVLKQSKDIVITKKAVKTSRLSDKLLGFSGNLALKNVKRNKRKYSATVTALFASMVMFVTISSFCSYALQSTEILSYGDFDIKYSEYGTEDKDEAFKVYKELSSVEGVTDSTFVNTYFLTANVHRNDADDFYIEYADEVSHDFDSKDIAEKNLLIEFLTDEKYNEYANSSGLNYKDFYNSKAPVAICYDRETDYDTERLTTYNILKNASGTLSATGITIEQGEEGETQVERYEYSFSFAYKTDTLPSCYEGGNYGIKLFYPESMKSAVMGNDVLTSSYISYFKSDNNMLSEEKMTEILLDTYGDSSMLENYSGEIQSERNLVTVIRVFSYGFIALITLISLVNIFNTVSTNVITRRREFAVLKSVGMTDRALRKMMNFECLLYGINSTVAAVPVSLIISYLIYYAMSAAMSFEYVPPIMSIIITVVSVFAVIFITMLYSMSKLKKDNVIETIKNENV